MRHTLAEPQRRTEGDDDRRRRPGRIASVIDGVAGLACRAVVVPTFYPLVGDKSMIHIHWMIGSVQSDNDGVDVDGGRTAIFPERREWA